MIASLVSELSRRSTSMVAMALVLGACSAGSDQADAGPDIPERVTGSFPEGWRLPAGASAEKAPKAMAVSNSPAASEAAVEILKAGGNAVDAAVALGFALTVTWPEAGNIGGGGYTVIHMADGRTAAIDYREIAPLAASRDMYLDAQGNLTDKSVYGHLASGVPGAVSGLTTLLAKYGTMPLAKVMAPAIRLAREGFVVDSGLAVSIGRAQESVTKYSKQETPYFPGGQPLVAGGRLVQPDLARTLQVIADSGAAGFYRSWVADSLVGEMQRNGGIITKEDLSKYEAVWRDPLNTSYRNFTLIGMPPSSSGGIVVAEALNVLEQYPTLPPYGSTEYFHLLGSAYQRAFIDRNAKLGDPSFVQVPIAELTSKSYAQKLKTTIGATAARTKDLEPQLLQPQREPEHTTHYSVVDAAGNAVATTTTLNNSWGSGVWVRGAGFMLNDEMDDFAAQPGKPNMFGLVQGEQNAIQPGKRMLSAMSPTIVLDPSKKVLLVLGAAGGPTIITGTSQVILNVIDNHMGLADAMRAPRVHHQGLPDSLTFETGGVRPEVLDSLRAMGYGMRELRSLVNVNAIMRVKGGWEGMPEPRRTGGARGY
jgi:gamma-glutamyltranspeptidase/glutathione hydrolase